MNAATVSLPPHRDHVRTVRLLAVAAARRADLAEDVVDDVRLAVGEAVARAVLRHEAAGLLAPVEVTLSDDGGRLAVTVVDRAPGHAPVLAAAADVVPALLAALAEVAESTSEGGTSVELSWALPSSRAAKV